MRSMYIADGSGKDTVMQPSQPLPAIELFTPPFTPFSLVPPTGAQRGGIKALCWAWGIPAWRRGSSFPQGTEGAEPMGGQ